MKIQKTNFGMTKDNQPISLYTIENASGASVTLSDYGCRIIKIMVPNKEGKLTDVILGLMMPMSILLMMPAWELLSVDAPTVSPKGTLP